MKRQQFRKGLLVFSLLLFPITLYYFSPALIINAAFDRVINGSFIVFALMLILSIPFGRFFCAYLCPAGGLQECVEIINDRRRKRGWTRYLKYIIWMLWLGSVIFCYCQRGETLTVDLFFETAHGVSVHDLMSYVIYYGVVFLIVLPAMLCGRRTFCQCFCWMAPFMILGTKIREFFHCPGLHIEADHSTDCIECGQCLKACPMSVDVITMVQKGSVTDCECIQCGACVDACPKHVLTYAMKYRKKVVHGSGKKTGLCDPRAAQSRRPDGL